MKENMEMHKVIVDLFLKHANKIMTLFESYLFNHKLYKFCLQVHKERFDKNR